MKHYILKKRLHLVRIAIITIIGFLFSQCTDSIIPNEKLESKNEKLSSTRAAFDDYFDWDRLDKFPIYNPNIGKEDAIELPWAKGSSVSLGIPTEWLDADAYSPNYSQRYYSRENSWVLVYSNLTKNAPNKYFALYNTYTGIMRFFFYALSSSSSGGNSSSFWGIKVNKSSSMLNFTFDFANSSGKKGDSPSFISSPPGTQMGSEFIGKGYQVNNWYGIEIECAYDPTIVTGSMHNFEIMGWSANKTTITGEGVTTGAITGTIKYAAPSSNFNVNLSNMFNQSNSTKNIVADNEGIINGLGGKIEEGIKNKNSFFTDLWNNIKGKVNEGIGEGVKNGLKAILTSGGSVAAKALSGAVSSILGVGGSKPSVAKVELSLSSNTKFSFEAETTLPGWGGISQFPVPGSSNNPNDMPLYNKPLGVWNLSRTPIIEIEGIAHNFENRSEDFGKGIYFFRYYLDCSQNDLIINNELKNKTTIQNFKAKIVFEKGSNFIFNQEGTHGYYSPIPYGFINNKEYYSSDYIALSVDGNPCEGLYGAVCQTDNSWEYIRGISPTEFDHGKFKAIITFDLVDNATGKIYSFSKWFNAQLGTQTVNYRNISISDNNEYDSYIRYIKNTGYPPKYGLNITEEFNIVQ